jgi:acyl-CoA synthetase (AMP-forming)/AMP-acid ligase II
MPPPASVFTPSRLESISDNIDLSKNTSISSSIVGDEEDDSTIRTVDELVRRRARSGPDQIIVGYPSLGTQYVEYSMQQLDVFAYRTAKYYQESIPTRQSSQEAPMVVAILGPSNFDYLVTILALTKLGHTVLFLSTRISRQAIESLLDVTRARFLLADHSYLETARSCETEAGSLQVLEIAKKSVFDFPIEVFADTKLDYALDLDIETENRVYIIHSSGRH